MSESRKAAHAVRTAMREDKLMRQALDDLKKKEEKEIKGHEARLAVIRKATKGKIPETSEYHVLSFLAGKTMAGKVGEKRKEVSGMRGRGGSPPPSKIRKY